MTITDIRIVGVNVTDQDAALTFYTETLGFSVQMDGDTPTGRWLVVTPPGASTGMSSFFCAACRFCSASTSIARYIESIARMPPGME